MTYLKCSCWRQKSPLRTSVPLPLALESIPSGKHKSLGALARCGIYLFSIRHHDHSEAEGSLSLRKQAITQTGGLRSTASAASQARKSILSCATCLLCKHVWLFAPFSTKISRFRFVIALWPCLDSRITALRNLS